MSERYSGATLKTVLETLEIEDDRAWVQGKLKERRDAGENLRYSTGGKEET